MHILRNDRAKVLITTSDYPPKLGGLSTYTLNVEKTLKALGVEFDTLVWNGLNDLKEKSKIPYKYKYGFHIHYLGGVYTSQLCERNINFCHGTELLFTSPNLLKKIFKKLIRPYYINYFRKSYLNIFISDFSLNVIKNQTLSIDYSRDIVFNNCIDTQNSRYIPKELDPNNVVFVCVGRDVPHKNLNYSYILCKELSKRLNWNITLYCTKDFEDNPLIKTINIKNINDSDLEKVYQSAHFNILPSLDHSHRGFFEGFGLTVLEAGKWGVPSVVSCYGGLPEACHNNETGLVIDPLKEDFDSFSMVLKKLNYGEISKNVFEHTHESHSLRVQEAFFKRVLRELL